MITTFHMGKRKNISQKIHLRMSLFMFLNQNYQSEVVTETKQLIYTL